MLLASVGSFFSTQAQLVEENARLRAKAMAYSHDAQRYEAIEAEAAHLRRLIGAAERLEVRAQTAEVLYHGRDPYAHRLFIDRGTTHGIRPGSPVTDESGVVGQVTRVHALLSEVTLVTDRDQAIPVQVVRNGLRAIAFGGGASGTLELRFMAANADIQGNDRLVTSGVDGTYPPGLPVATVMRIEKDAENAFARVVCRPAAGVDRGRFVLVLSNDAARPPRPEEAATDKREKRRGRLKDPDAR
jgi:rod shape-determining protein MreC